jgi:hypothetical protein
MYAEFPYLDWNLDSTGNDCAILKIFGRVNEIHIQITPGECEVIYPIDKLIKDSCPKLPPSLLLKVSYCLKLLASFITWFEFCRPC